MFNVSYQKAETFKGDCLSLSNFGKMWSWPAVHIFVGLLRNTAEILVSWQHCPESEAGTQRQASCCPCSQWSCGSRPPGGQSCSRGWGQLSRCQRSSLVGGRTVARQVLPSLDLLSNQIYRNNYVLKVIGFYSKLKQTFFNKPVGKCEYYARINIAAGFVCTWGRPLN